ncbi:hypothetical protein [Nostocoides sp. HKS02]|uniref:hypothetical protein n=1 Tax=Nostocoides sp. HKS02 TaxID=1813880 RepID=UPI0012B46185|nr:hypothetical protein [Tetrasphaera sp. HKS02]QGN56898.1 hypothetical protein GKE56_02200 [Tetrasphaera sp. HKS02]
MIARLQRLAPGQQVMAALTVAVAVGAVAVTVPALHDVGLLFASAGLVAAVAVLAASLWQHQHATEWSDPTAEPRTPRGADARIAGLAQRIDAAVGGDDTAGRRVHETLAGLARERLRDRRGLVLGDPGAGAALGADLAAYLTDPATTRLTADRLATFITTLEEL